MEVAGFMHKYFDWGAFEEFVKELHEGDGEVTVQRHVVEVDRHGAKRETDIKITRRSRFQRFTTLVECKRWKEPVGRDRVDVLASSIEALGANAGAVFTTTGFEEGAVAYAKAKGIELFVVRDLTSEEWGLPGRHVALTLHVNTGQFRNIRFGAQAIPLVDPPLPPAQINIDVSLEKALDPDFDLYSVKTGENGPNLVGIFGDTHALLTASIAGSLGVLEGGRELILGINAPRCEIDFTRTEFCQLRLPKFAARIERISVDFRTHIAQCPINVDRGRELDFAVMVESHVSDRRLLAHRRLGNTNITFQGIEADSSTPASAEPPLQNGSLMRVQCAPWIGLGDSVANKEGRVDQFLRVFVETDNRKAKLALQIES